MKNIYAAFTVLLLFSTVGFSQVKQTNTFKEKVQIQPQDRIAKMMDSREFEFVAITAYPLGSSPIDLTANGNSVTFGPEMIISNMPFFGRGYSGVALSKDKGLKFQGKPENFNIEKNAKNYEISVLVKGKNDTYTLSLRLAESGYGMLTITSNDRGAISYRGEIRKISSK